MEHPEVKSFDEFVEKVLKCINIGSVEERESSSYIEERYVKGIWENYKITLAISDEDDVRGLDYWVSIETIDEQSDDKFDTTIDSLIKKHLKPCGFRINKAVDFGKVTMEFVEC